MILFTLTLVLFSCFISGFLNSNISVLGASFVSCVLLGLSSLIAFYNFNKVILTGQNFWFELPNWLSVGSESLDWQIFNDNLSAIMCVVVLTISGLVHLYSSFYMEGDPHIGSFLCYLSLFTVLMLVLVSAGNMIQLFIGWEGVGICSYLLVSFWNTSNAAINSALNAILVNSFGDVGFIMATIVLLNTTGSLQFEEMEVYFNGSSQEVNLLTLLVLIAVAGNSAQFGLHSWLPDAMEGPTPVSALIHAATMVTAGIFLIVNLSFLFGVDNIGSTVTILLGSLTAVFAASVGLLQNDFNNVIAYSTCSQLGYMALVCGVGEFSLSLFHLFNHAFFNALLFLSAGSIIHALSDDQDFSNSGVLLNSNPLASTCILIGSLSLMGLPFLTGFYSKDVIIEIASQHNVATMGYWLALLSALFTASYSFSLICMGLLSASNSSLIVENLAEESTFGLNFSLIVLAILSICVGYFSMYTVNTESIPLVSTTSNQYPLIFSILGSLLAVLGTSILGSSWNESFSNSSVTLQSQSIFQFLSNAWNYDNIFHSLLTGSMLNLGDFFYHSIDSQAIEFFGPWQFSNLFVKLANSTSFYNTGSFFNYLFATLIFILTVSIIY